jgi:cobalt/nickel transport system permease protein
MSVLSAGGLAVALRETRRHLPPRRVPLLGLCAAFVFAAQMLNFPVAGGTSGHLIGGVLTAVLLGPSAAVIVISSVLIVQCFLFADGGVTALGANIFNMAMIGGVNGRAIYYRLSRMVKGLMRRIVAATFPAWLSTVVAAIVCAGELAASGTVPWKIAFPAMAGVHALIGVGEAIITAIVLVTVWTNRPDLVALPRETSNAAKPYRPLIAYGGLIALGLALFISPFASRAPDGLDKTAADHGFLQRATLLVQSPFSGYHIPERSTRDLATALAGAIGVILVFALAWIFAGILVRKSVAHPTSPAASKGEKCTSH